MTSSLFLLVCPMCGSDDVDDVTDPYDNENGRCLVCQRCYEPFGES